jgi:2-phospho-L-lactate/phosphoenolpyruvate guanylyltransferase
MTTAIIPVKPLRESKTRLAHLLSPEERAALMGCLLGRTLAALRPTAVSQVIVVSGDEAVLAQARAAGADTLREERPFSLNTAVSLARDRAVQQGADRILILPADLPLVQTADIVAVLDSVRSQPARPLMVICGDETEQGTNALLLDPPAPFAFHYGPGSFARHCAEAEENGRVVWVVNGRSLQFDLDTEADWRRLDRCHLEG